MNEELRTVAERISGAVLEFIQQQEAGAEFHASDLRDHVTLAVGVTAPGSADRILRHLRQKGRLNYRVVSRAKSLYQVA